MTEEEYHTRKFWFLISNNETGMIVHDTMDRVNAKKHLDWTSRSGAYDTKEMLIDYKGIPDEPCKSCGSVFGTNFIEPVKTQLISRNICFTCMHWMEKIEIKDKPTTVRVNHMHYKIEPDDPKAYFKGFGGAEFKIRFHDGREVVTHNLWYQGEIPERFWDRLPDNAVFIQ
jgi:hypothetical protein